MIEWEKLAAVWEEMADAWDKPEEYGTDVTIAGARLLNGKLAHGLCFHIREHSVDGTITTGEYLEMQRAINRKRAVLGKSSSHTAIGESGIHTYLWPLDSSGAKKRAAFCWEQVQYCMKRAAKESKQ